MFLIQSTSSPTNDNLMELLVALDALKRGSANRITAVIPTMDTLDKIENRVHEPLYQLN